MPKLTDVIKKSIENQRKLKSDQDKRKHYLENLPAIERVSQFETRLILSHSKYDQVVEKLRHIEGDIEAKQKTLRILYSKMVYLLRPVQ